MIVGDEAAGKAAVECLIEQGSLVPDFWFRVHENHKDHNKWSNTDPCNKQVADAVKFAMGVAGVELPEWASPEYDLPNWTWIQKYYQRDFPTTEPYYTTGTLQETFIKCYSSSAQNEDDSKIQAGVFRSLSLRAWRRIVPHFSPELSEEILQIEDWPKRGYRGHSKKYEINHQLDGLMIKDTAFREFYDQQGVEGLSSIFHGLGKRAVFGVGAMLFIYGEHEDLLRTSEQLEEVLNPA